MNTKRKQLSAPHHGNSLPAKRELDWPRIHEFHELALLPVLQFLTIDCDSL